MRNLIFVAMWVFVAGSVGSAVADVVEVEPNNTFSNRHMLPVGTSVVNGAIGDIDGFDPNDYDMSWSGTLLTGNVDYYQHPAAAGSPFIAWIDTGDTLDTVLGTFDEGGDLIDFNDDGYYYDYFASWIGGAANSNDTINLGVTSFGDNGFTGAIREGSYDLFLKLDGTFADVDFLTFSGLTPGNEFVAEITSGTFDTLLGIFDDAGTLLQYDDNNGAGDLSKLAGIVPVNGILNFAITTSTDPQFMGLHYNDSGDYTLTLTSVPEPATIVLWLLMGAAGVGYSRRRLRQAA